MVGTRAAAFAPVAGPRPGGDLGRRRRPARRAARAVPARPRDPAAARRARGRGRAGGRLRDERRGRAAGPLGLGAPARRLPRGAARAGSPSRSPGPTSTRWPGTRSPGPPGCRPRCTARSATRSRPDRCSCRPRAAGTPRPLPASGAAPRRAAGSAPARWRSARPPRHRPAGGAAPPTRPGPAPSAATAACGHRSWGRPAPRRSWAGRSPAPWSAPRAATGCWPRSTTSRPSSWPPRAPSRWPPVATRPSSCSTPGWCSAWPTCGPRRRRCGAGPTPSAWSAPAAARSSVGDPAHPAVQALVRWDPAGFAAREAAQRREAHLPPASRLATITGEPGAVDDALTLLDPPIGFELLGPVPFGARRRVPGRRPRAAQPRPRPLPRARRGAAGPLGPQARRGPHPGRPADPVRLASDLTPRSLRLPAALLRAHSAGTP